MENWDESLSGIILIFSSEIHGFCELPIDLDFGECSDRSFSGAYQY